ncbi:IclR family transcriptional regulator [Knoellia subterranea]|uniref:Glycerol operon regulatory protein n=1 Tax=Knoellia subterranea KCTC 19937 TaxID=1385521 RepID=A0A0A0JKC6_9MICO|nr:IclR family transcriptional regulator [Knoellia subterranea]KGN37900.1 IclR family transcriptional regulator [Knoellia subterranea KCTC 19937]
MTASDEPADSGRTRPGRGTAPSNARAAAHALDVLELLAGRGEPLPAAAVARELGIPRSSTYHLLSLLRERGYVSHLDGERRFGLGVAAYELGSAYQRQAPLQRIARSTLDRLVDSTGHNAHLAVLHGRDVLYVIEQRAPRGPVLVSDVGVRLPATLTATGLALLAALPQPQVRALFPHADALVQRDGHGPTTTTELRSLLQAVRQRGYAVEDGHITSGLKSVAVAVLDHSEHPVASVAVTFRSDLVDDATFGRIVSAVGRSADDLSARLHRQPRSPSGT